MKKYVVIYHGFKKLGEYQIPDTITNELKEEMEDTRIMLAQAHGIPEKKVKVKIVERKVKR